MKKSIVLIPLPSLIKNSFVRSFSFFLADQHRKRPWFIRSFRLLLGPRYRVSPASHTKRCFSRYLYQRLYFLPVLGKRLPVKTVSRIILSYATLWLRLGHQRNTDAHRETDLQNQQTRWGKDSAQRTRCLRYCSSCAINWMKEETPIMGDFSPTTYAEVICYVKLMGEFSPTMYAVKVLLW